HHALLFPRHRSRRRRAAGRRPHPRLSRSATEARPGGLAPMKPMLEAQRDPATQGAVPIRCFGGEALQPDELSWRQLADMDTLPGVRAHVTVLPDVHAKPRNPTPSGTVVVTNDYIFPRAIDDGMNCGMRSMATDMDARAFTPEVIDALFGRIKETVPAKRHEEPLLGEHDTEELLVHGMEKMVAALGLPEDELLRTENGGRFELGLDPDQIRA